MSTRTFTVVGISSVHGVEKGKEYYGGVYHSKTPVSAVKKAATRICRALNLSTQCVLIIRIRLTLYTYSLLLLPLVISRIKHDVVVNKGDVQIEFKYTVKATSLNQFSGLKAIAKLT